VISVFESGRNCAFSARKGVCGRIPGGPVDIIYLQSPSVKGVSGGPVISLDTGTVVGIATLKLTGISEALRQERGKVQAFQNSGSSMRMGNVDVLGALGGIIGILDDQLANGLGAATGAKEAADKLGEAQKQTTAPVK
jgi:hypothetical protein